MCLVLVKVQIDKRENLLALVLLDTWMDIYMKRKYCMLSIS